jgi:predicted alpha/beta superfamily hydrolase
MKRKLMVLAILSVQVSASYAQAGSSTIIAGKRITISSEILDYDPEIHIGLPDNFSDTTAYPVIMLLDAEWLFPAFAGITKLMGQMGEIPECIVVGIQMNDSFEDYGMEFAPKISGVPNSGHADKILDFFSKELFPFIESTYNGTGSKIIWAHSAPGGLFCTYVLLGQDRQFSGIISSSPNLRGVQEYIQSEESYHTLSQKDPTFYYFSFGTEEEEMFREGLHPQILEFRDILENRAPDNLVWIYRSNEHNNHFTNAIESYIDGLKLYFEWLE